MSAFDPAQAAAALRAARNARAPAGPLPEAIAPRSTAEAALVQVALATSGIGGFKIGATGTRMQAMLGLPGPAAGFMAPQDIHASGVSLRHDTLRGPGVECEIAVTLARDLPPGPCTPDAAASAIGSIAAAIELVENRYGAPPIGDLAALGTPTLVADQVYHVAAVVGPPSDWSPRRLAGLTGTLQIDGVARDRGLGSELLGDPLRALAWLAASEVAAAFGGLRAGHTIMLGSVVPTLWLDGPCEISVAFADEDDGPALAMAVLRLV